MDKSKLPFHSLPLTWSSDHIYECWARSESFLVDSEVWCPLHLQPRQTNVPLEVHTLYEMHAAVNRECPATYLWCTIPLSRDSCWKYILLPCVIRKIKTTTGIWEWKILVDSHNYYGGRWKHNTRNKIGRYVSIHIIITYAFEIRFTESQRPNYRQVLTQPLQMTQRQTVANFQTLLCGDNYHAVFLKMVHKWKLPRELSNHRKVI